MALLPEMDLLTVSPAAKSDQIILREGDEIQIMQQIEKTIDAQHFSFYPVSRYEAHQNPCLR